MSAVPSRGSTEQKLRARRQVGALYRQRPWPTVDALAALVGGYSLREPNFAPYLVTELRVAGMFPFQGHQPRGVRA